MNKQADPKTIKFRYDPKKNPRHKFGPNGEDLGGGGLPGIPRADLDITAVNRMAKHEYNTVVHSAFYVDVLPGWLPDHAQPAPISNNEPLTAADLVTAEPEPIIKKGGK